MYNIIYAINDCETGSLSPETGALCEVAFAPFDNGLVNLPEYTAIIAPYNPALQYTSGALQANGMSMEQIENGLPAKQVFEEVCEYLVKLKRGRELPVFCAHNRKFDFSFISEFFKFFKKDFSDFINPEYSIDTMFWSRSGFPESVNYKLPTCISNAGIEQEQQHRALSDARVTRDLTKYFITNMRSEATGVKSERFRDKFEF